MEEHLSKTREVQITEFFKPIPGTNNGINVDPITQASKPPRQGARLRTTTMKELFSVTQNRKMNQEAPKSHDEHLQGVDEPRMGREELPATQESAKGAEAPVKDLPETETDQEDSEGGLKEPDLVPGATQEGGNNQGRFPCSKSLNLSDNMQVQVQEDGEGGATPGEGAPGPRQGQEDREVLEETGPPAIITQEIVKDQGRFPHNEEKFLLCYYTG